MIRRDCKTCKAGKDQSWNSCGYISKEERRGREVHGTFQPNKIDFPALKNPEFTIEKCPVWFYNEYEHVYTKYNFIKNSHINLEDLSFQLRTIYNTFGYYTALRQAYESEKKRKIKGK